MVHSGCDGGCVFLVRVASLVFATMHSFAWNGHHAQPVRTDRHSYENEFFIPLSDELVGLTPLFPDVCDVLVFFFRYGRKIGDSVELQETQGIAYGVARVVIGWSQVSEPSRICSSHQFRTRQG